MVVAVQPEHADGAAAELLAVQGDGGGVDDGDAFRGQFPVGLAQPEMPAVQRALLQRVVPNLDTKRWSVVYVDNAHMTSLDRETVKKTSEDQFDLWVRRDYVEPMKLSKGTADHTLTHEAVDCSGAHFRVLKSVAYSASGKPVLVIETPFERQDIVPASVGEKEYAEICNDAREVGKPSK